MRIYGFLQPQNIPDNNTNCDLYKTKGKHTQFLADLFHLEVIEMHISLFLPFDDALCGGQTWSYWGKAVRRNYKYLKRKWLRKYLSLIKEVC